MKGTTDSPDRPRGRPRRNQRGAIPDELLRALRDVLAYKPADEVTLREIAAAAGTSSEMVRYYFNGKAGLLAALLELSLARVRARLDQLGTDLEEASDGHSRLIVTCLWSIYLDEREAGKLFNSEYVRTRARTHSLQQAGRADTIVVALHRCVARLIERGIYRATIDPVQTAILIMSLTGCPARLLETLSDRWISEEYLRQPQWIDDIAAMVDSHCLG